MVGDCTRKTQGQAHQSCTPVHWKTIRNVLSLIHQSRFFEVKGLSRLPWKLWTTQTELRDSILSFTHCECCNRSTRVVLVFLTKCSGVRHRAACIPYTVVHSLCGLLLTFRSRAAVLECKIIPLAVFLPVMAKSCLYCLKSSLSS